MPMDSSDVRNQGRNYNELHEDDDKISYANSCFHHYVLNDGDGDRMSENLLRTMYAMVQNRYGGKRRPNLTDQKFPMEVIGREPAI